jgi:hypothetical protein
MLIREQYTSVDKSKTSYSELLVDSLK